MKALKLNFLFKLLILVILPLFLFFLSFPKSASATITCPGSPPWPCSNSTRNGCFYRSNPYCGSQGQCLWGSYRDDCPNGQICSVKTSPATCIAAPPPNPDGTCVSPNVCTAPGICRAEGGTLTAGTCSGNTPSNPIVCCSFSDGGGGGLPPGSKPPKVPNPNCYYKGCETEQSTSRGFGCNGFSCFTAFGNISTKPEGFVTSVFGIILSLVGVVSVLMIIISGYKLMVSQGNPEKLQGAKEQLTAAIVGLLFVIFSFFILQTIGVNLLNLPGFTQ